MYRWTFDKYNIIIHIGVVTGCQETLNYYTDFFLYIHNQTQGSACMADMHKDNPPPEYPPDVVRLAMDRAMNEILADTPAAQSIERIVAVGLDPQTAAALYGQVRGAIKTSRRRSAIFLITAGAFWLMACVVAWLLTHFAVATFKPGLGRTMVLLSGIGLVQIVAGYFRWRRASRL